MKRTKLWILGATIIGALVVGLLEKDAIAKLVGRLYGNSLHVETEPRDATLDVTLGDDDAYIGGTLEVDSTVRLDGATSAFAPIGIATATAGATTFRLRGAYSSTQISLLTPTAGDLVFNTSLFVVCGASGTTTGAWVLPRSTDTTATLIKCY